MFKKCQTEEEKKKNSSFALRPTSYCSSWFKSHWGMNNIPWWRTAPTGTTFLVSISYSMMGRIGLSFNCFPSPPTEKCQIIMSNLIRRILRKTTVSWCMIEKIAKCSESSIYHVNNYDYSVWKRMTSMYVIDQITPWPRHRSSLSSTGNTHTKVEHPP